MEKKKLLCYKKTYDIYEGKGECPQECEYGAWQMTAESVCGAECLSCGGTLYLAENGHVVCDSCNHPEPEF